MLLTLSQIALATLPSRALNILISPGGDGNLLSQVEDILLPTTIHKDFTFSSLALISSQLLISGLFRYLVGHVVTTLLILEIARKDGISDQRRGNNKRPLTFRSIYNAIRLIYGIQGLYTFSYALVMAIVYRVTRYTIIICLETTIFRHELLIPISYACSSVLLCKLHLIWTCATISAHRPRLFSLTKSAHQTKWIHLAVPSFIYGICQALMNEAQSLMQGSMIFPKDLLISTSRRAGAEIFTVIIMIAFRLLGLLPASIILILTEASLLPDSLETMIPSPTKKRGSTIAELFGGKVSTGLAACSSALKDFGVPQFLWLIELHLKKCFVQIAFGALALPIILLAVL